MAKLAAPDQPLLEIGCGEGYGTGWLAERFAAVDAVDIDPGAVARAAALCAGHGQCRVQSYDGRTLPFPDATFATVVALQVIEHVAGPAAMLAEMARVARPGGLVLITTPNRAYRVAAGKKPWNRFHVREYDAGELRAELLPYFSTVTLHGVRARADIETREKDRCRRAQRLAALDPLNLRFLLTPALETGMARLLRRLARPAPAVQAVAATLADYYLSEDDPAEGLDLLAACRRPA